MIENIIIVLLSLLRGVQLHHRSMARLFASLQKELTSI